MAIEDRLEELFMNDANNRRVASVNMPQRPSPWRGVIAFVGAAAIVGIVAVAAILALRGEPQAAAPNVSASPIPTSSTAPIPTSTASAAASVSPSKAPPAATVGTVTGALGYPSDFIPAQVIYALPTTDTTDGRYFVETELSRSALNYTINVPPGAYYLVAYTRDSPAGTTYGGAYTQYVKCGMVPPCADHTLIAVIVTAGETVTGIDVRDWYDGGHYPPRPR